MKIILTKHAEQRMNERSIKINEIKEVIMLPDYTIKKGDYIEAYKEINSRGLKIVYSQKGKFIKIITVILK